MPDIPRAPKAGKPPRAPKSAKAQAAAAARKPKRTRATDSPRATGGSPASAPDAIALDLKSPGLNGVQQPALRSTTSAASRSDSGAGESAPAITNPIARPSRTQKKSTSPLSNFKSETPAATPPSAAPSPSPTLSPETLSLLQSILHHTFKSPALLAQALTHASVTDSRLASNERMEFLGDSVLGLVISERIYQRYPNLLEGEMTKLKSTAVSRQTCAVIARALGLHKHLVLGKGMQNHHELPLSLEAAVLESIIAAIYLDAGYAAAEAFIAPLIDPYILRAAADGHQENFKSVLQHYAQQQSLPPPSYRVLDEKGPDHAKAFKVTVDLAGRRFTPAWGQTKKKSEQMAALNALQELGLVQTRDDGHLSVVGGE
jgi:ribonuclease-3